MTYPHQPLSQPSPGTPYPYPPVSPPPAARGPSRWGKVMLVALVTGVLVLVAAGGGGFAIARASASAASGGGNGPESCVGRGAVNCIPGLAAETVSTTLTDAGFECDREFADPDSGYGPQNAGPTEPSVSWTCALVVGNVRYDASLTSYNDRVHSYLVSAGHSLDLPLSPRAEGFLEWFAALPFGDDPEAEAVAIDWVADKMAAGEPEAWVTIRGFEYEYWQEESPILVRLFVRGGF